MEPGKILQAMQRAKDDGNEAAVRGLRKMLNEAYLGDAGDPTAEMGSMDRFRAGVGMGMTNVVDKGKQLIGLGEDKPRAGEEQLRSTRAGGIGNFVGEVAATAPLGGVAGAGAKQLAGRLGSQGLRRSVSGVGAQGAIQGATEGAYMSDPGDRLSGALVGAAGGAVLPKALTGAANVAGRGIRASAPARALQRAGDDAGVDVDLTPGQLNPRSAVGQMEESATNLPLVGPLINNARQAAKENAEQLVLTRASAPGAPRATSLDDAYKSYGPAYDQAKGFPIGYPGNFNTNRPLASFGSTAGLIQRAVADPNIQIGPQERSSAYRWLVNQLEALPGEAKRMDVIDSDHLLKMRSNIRKQVRSRVQQNKLDEAALMRNAEKVLTDVLRSHLPEQALDALDRTDAHYAAYKVIEDAFERSGDNLEGLSFSQLSRAIKKATEKGKYARGDKGPRDLRVLSQAGKQVFDTRTPPTGARLATLGGAALLGNAMGAGLTEAAVAGTLGTVAATSRTGRQAMAGRLPGQAAIRAAILRAQRGLGRGGRQATTAATAATGSTAGREYRGR